MRSSDRRGPCGAREKGGEEAPRQRRILSLDRGGTRGVLTLGILERIEALLRKERGNSRLVLADEIDLIAGTSTGAIIATCLSWDMEAHEILDLYEREGARMFRRAPRWAKYRLRYRSSSLASMFREILAEEDGRPALLGSSRLRTLLLVVVCNGSTGSAWPLTNNSDAMFNDAKLPDCDLNIPLWRLLRASTAAPAFLLHRRRSGSGEQV